jgi:ABC-2 type transport system permease protein
VRQLSNIVHLGIKELRSLVHDPAMLILIVFAFSISIYAVANGAPDTLQSAPIAIVDEDRSTLSERVIDGFYPPYFVTPSIVSATEADRGLDVGRYTFALDIPPEFQKDVAARRNPQVQLNVDATRMSQAFSGTGYVQEIVQGQASEFVNRNRSEFRMPVDLAMRTRFNPNLTQSWFTSVMELINEITLLSIILTGAALIREREHGTVEHLLVMPVTPFEIMVSKIWSMSLVVIVASALSLVLIIEGVLKVPIEGSRLLFMLGTSINMFATTSLGILLGTVARSMPQLGLLVILTVIPLQALSGAMTPRESMPQAVQDIMLVAPTTHFVKIAQAILYRGAGIETVWPQFLALFAIGAGCFVIALLRFRKTITQMA